MRKSSQYIWPRWGLYDVIRGEVPFANSFVVGFFFLFFFYCCAKNRIFKSPPFNPPNPHGRQETRARWLKCGVDYPILIGRFFTKTWRKRDVEWNVAVNLGESISVSLQSVVLIEVIYIRLRYFVRIDRSSPQPARAGLITTCVAHV